MPPYKTPTTAAMIGVRYDRLYSLLRYRVIPLPERRDSSGHFLWTAQEVETARLAVQTLDAQRRKAASI